MPARSSLVFVAPALIMLLAAIAAAPARADSPLWRRPTFQIALGMGLSYDGADHNPRPDDPVPSFFFTAGLGDGLLGLQLRTFANAGNKQQVTRVSGELACVIRPLVPATAGRAGYGQRVLRSFGVDLGPAIERVGAGVSHAWRAGAVLGTHFDLPIGYEGAVEEPRVRLGVRRLFGTSTSVADIPIGDSGLELYGQLVFVF